LRARLSPALAIPWSELRNYGNYGDTPFFTVLRRRAMVPFMTRIVVPGLPHHVTQRGNRGERIFFEAEGFSSL
jgi:hypothetical protein